MKLFSIEVQQILRVGLVTLRLSVFHQLNRELLLRSETLLFVNLLLAPCKVPPFLGYAEKRVTILCASVKAAARSERRSSAHASIGVGRYKRTDGRSIEQAGFYIGKVVVIGGVSYVLYGAILNRGEIITRINPRRLATLVGRFWLS